jgi:hypothetical protein
MWMASAPELPGEFAAPRRDRKGKNFVFLPLFTVVHLHLLQQLAIATTTTKSMFATTLAVRLMR